MKWHVAQKMLSAVLAALLVVLFVGVMSGDAPARAAQAPGFTLQLLDGKALRLADMRGSPVILLFWAPW